jgi:hypothetical protein
MSRSSPFFFFSSFFSPLLASRFFFEFAPSSEDHGHRNPLYLYPSIYAEGTTAVPVGCAGPFAFIGLKSDVQQTFKISRENRLSFLSAEKSSIKLQTI